MCDNQKLNFRITTLAESWSKSDSSASLSSAQSCKPTNSEKVTALVQMMRTQWTEDHVAQTYVARLTATDPHLIIVALQGTNPIGNT